MTSPLQYQINIENFEGPLDLLCHLIDCKIISAKGYDLLAEEIFEQI